MQNGNHTVASAPEARQGKTQNGNHRVASSPKDQEPIAVVGMSCRWPGGVRNPNDFWELLKNNHTGHREFGDHRFSREGFHHPNFEHPGTVPTEKACLLSEDPRLFDHSFFGVNAGEVETLDPSQRKLLEVVYEAFESAGVPWDSFSGSETGVYVGNFTADHLIIQTRDVDHPRPHAGVGTGNSILSNRINYIFNLRGPSITIDTACSSSLYALHLAVSAIRNGDCESAIVAASNTIMDPSTQMTMAKMGILSPSSTSHTFDATADGYARGEGFGALYIKRQSAAVRDGNPIRALVRGTAINANGRTGGISHPGREGQEAVIRKAYANAGIPLHNTHYFECHGTGTPVGDPIEMSAIANVFQNAKSSSDPLLVGSVKTNIGHTEAGSAIASIMKVILAMENGEIPATVGIKTLNPKLDTRSGMIQVVTKNTPWPAGAFRRSSVNSFGYGGANGHCIIDFDPNSLLLPSTDISPELSASSSPIAPDDSWKVHYPMTPRKPEVVASEGGSSETRRLVLLPFSAHSQLSLNLNIKVLSEILTPKVIADIAYTLSDRRSRFKQRTFRILDTGESPKQSLLDVIEPDLTCGSKTAKVGFVFTGQGAQWHGMGASLFQYHVFETSILYLDALLQRLPQPPSWKIEDVLRGKCDPGLIQSPEVAQTASTALQIGLVDLLDVWNIRPEATVGHSSGEIAAVYASGRITAAEAIAAAYLRGRAVSQNVMKGSMLAVGFGEEEALKLVTKYHPQVRIGAINSSSSVTITGDQDAIVSIAAELSNRKIFNRLLKTGNTAYHSHHMVSVGEAYETNLWKHLEYIGRLGQADATLRYPERAGPWVSSVFPNKNSSEIQITPAYWRENLQSPVRFSDAVSIMVNRGNIDVVLEVGPHAALKGPLGDITRRLEKKVTYVEALRRLEDGQMNLLRLAGNLFCLNAEVDLAAVNAVDRLPDGQDRGVQPQLELVRGLFSPLVPQYEYSYGPILYHESRLSQEFRSRSVPRHDLLGSLLPGTTNLRPQWRNFIRLKDARWLDDHKISPHIVFPAAGYIASAIEAASRVHAAANGGDRSAITGYEFRNIRFISMLRVPKDDIGVEIMTSMELSEMPNGNKLSSAWATFTLSSITTDSGQWAQHCTGRIRVHTAALPKDAFSRISIDMDARGVSAPIWYKRFAELGLEYGPAFQPLSGIQADPSQNLAVAQVALGTTKEIDAKYGGASAYTLHPTSLDAIFQLALIASYGGKADEAQNAYVPTEIDNMYIKNGITVVGGQESATAIATARLRGLRSAHAKLQLLDTESGELVMNINNLRSVLFTQGALNIPSSTELLKSQPFSNPYSRLVWRPDVRTINNEQAARLFPPPVENLNDVWLFDKFDRLTTLYVVDIHERYANLDQLKSAPSDIQHFMGWVGRRFQDDNQLTIEARQLSAKERRALIEVLAGEIDHIADAKIASVVFQNIADILFQRRTGLDVMLKDGVLHDVYDHGFLTEGAYRQFNRFLDLYSHSEPNARILEVGAGTGGATRNVLRSLTGANGAKRYQDYTFTDISSGFLNTARQDYSKHPDMKYSVLDISADPSKQGYEAAAYDLVISCECLHATPNITETLTNCRKLLRPGGKIVMIENTRTVIGHTLVMGHMSGYWDGAAEGRIDSPFLPLKDWDTKLTESGFSGAQLALEDYPQPYATAHTIVSTAIEPTPSPSAGPMSSSSSAVYLIHGQGNAQSSLIRQVASEISAIRGLQVEIRPMGSILPERNGNYIVFANGDDNLLVHANERHLEGLKNLIRHSASLLWITSGGLMNGTCADAAITTGLLRTVATENPTVQFASIDDNSEEEKSGDHHNSRMGDDLAGAIVKLQIFMWQQKPSDRKDSEFVWKRGCLWVSRIVPDMQLQNQRLLTDYSASRAEMLPWADREMTSDDGTPVALRAAFETPGSLTSLYFRPYEETWRLLQDDWIEAKVTAVGLNWKDLLVSTGRFDEDNLSSEYSGTVCRVGSNVISVAVGDQVYGYGRGHFGTHVRGPAKGVCLLRPGDDPVKMASLPIVGMTAVYALEKAAHLKKNERVLIMNGTGGLGLMSIQLAKAKGAEIYATVGTPEKRRFLVEHHDIPDSHIFPSRDIAAIHDMVQVTNGRGFDVILSTAAGEMLHEAAATMLAPMARFIDLARLDVIKAESLSMDIFSKNATFTSFDLSIAEKLDSDLCPSLMRSLDAYIRSGTLSPISPVKVFHVSELDKALSTLSKGTHLGKIVVTYEDDKTSLVKIVPPAPRAIFRPDASYIVVGGFGTLGRSILAFMASRGAKHLTILARSVKLTREAARLVKRLTASGVNVQCDPCDISDPNQVIRAVSRASAIQPIRGVVHAAMFLHDISFDKVTIDIWTSVIASKVHGTKNLHEATKDCPLDFFVMTTSIEVIVALATQGAYTAANNFQDYFARWRLRQRLPASTVSFGLINDMGHLSTDSTTLALMARNGVQQISEHEMIKLLEPAFLDQGRAGLREASRYSGAEEDPLAMANIFTCFDPLELTKYKPGGSAGGENSGAVVPRWYSDPRVALVMRSMRDAERHSLQDAGGSHDIKHDKNKAPLKNEFAVALGKIRAASAGEHDSKEEREAAVGLVARAIVRTVAQMLFIEESAVVTENSVAQYGVDSLVAAELRSWFNMALGVDVDMLRVLDNGVSIWDLAMGILEQELEEQEDAK